MAYKIVRIDPVFPKQQQAYHDTSDGYDYREVTGKLGGSASEVSGVNARYGQECHVSVQQYSSLPRRGA